MHDAKTVTRSYHMTITNITYCVIELLCHWRSGLNNFEFLKDLKVHTLFQFPSNLSLLPENTKYTTYPLTMATNEYKVSGRTNVSVKLMLMGLYPLVEDTGKL